LRRVHRQALPRRVETYLDRQSQKIAADPTAATTLWNNARRTKTIATYLLEVLREMAGRCERCMYCNDSRGTDVEHYRPKAAYPDKTFLWENMLLACTGCNRKKLERFPLGPEGQALLIDPSVDDPWEFLDFVPETGELTARWRTDLDGFDLRGEATVDPFLLPLNIEAVTTGRQRCWRALRKAIKRFLDDTGASDETSAEHAFEKLTEELRDSADYGLTRWLFHFCASETEPLLDRLRANPGHWERLRAITAE
jgi:uncharacterized protein (TIGR02646 family)